MIRILFVARYRSPGMHRKVELLAERKDLEIVHVMPATWQDEFGEMSRAEETVRYRRILIPMVGVSSDPHRAFYRSLSRELCAFYPDIIHAEEEPDSLTALQLTCLRKSFFPRALLVVYTWQNVNRPKRLPVSLVTQMVLRSVDHVICGNKEGVLVLRQQGYRGLTTVLPAIGVDERVFKPKGHRGKSVDGEFRIGFVGRLVKEKGIDDLIESFIVVSADADIEMKPRLVIMGGHRRGTHPGDVGPAPIARPSGIPSSPVA